MLQRNVAVTHRRYLYDMFYTYERIPRKVLDYCVAEVRRHNAAETAVLGFHVCFVPPLQKLADANLMAKWKKPGYDRLCCTHAINPRNHNFGTVSICRVGGAAELWSAAERQNSSPSGLSQVPKKDLEPGRIVVDVTCGCLGCASGEGGFRNIFGNKFGQSLASIQHAREARAEQAASLAASVVEAMDGSGESPAPTSTGDDVVDEAVASAVADFGEEGDADGAAEAAADAVLAAFPTVWAEPGEEEEEDTAAVLAAQGSNVEDGPSAEDMAAMAAAMGGGAETAAAEDDAAPPPSAKRPRTEA